MPKQKTFLSEYRNYYMPQEFPALLLSGSFWSISMDRPDKTHFHNCMEIGLCLQNRGEMELYGERVLYEEGDITVIPRNVPHSTWVYPDETSLWCYLMIDPKALFHDLLPDFEKEFDLYPYLWENENYIFKRKDHPDLYELLQQIIEEMNGQKPHYQVVARALLLAFYMKVFRIHNAAREEREEALPDSERLVISPALDYIEVHYMQTFTIEFLAELCHFSATHFRRVFHEIMGASPLDFINTTRIMKACDLLRSTEEPVLNISEMVGFHSVSSFNRLFSKIMRMTPREYRRRAGTPVVLVYEGSVRNIQDAAPTDGS